MIVIKQSDLGDMPLDVLRQVMGLPESELIVCIKTLDNGHRVKHDPADLDEPSRAPVVPQNVRQDDHRQDMAPTATEGETAISSLVVQSDATDSLSVYTSAPPPPNPDRSEFGDRPPRLPEHGCTYAQLCAAAEAVRMTVRLNITGSGVILTDPLAGAVAYPDWPSAIRVINARRDFGILGYARGVIGG